MQRLKDPLVAALGTALAPLGVVAALAGCAATDGGSGTSGSGAAPAIHDAAGARARWTTMRPRHYRFTYLPSCFCDQVPGRVTVTDGTVVAWVAEPTTGATSDGSAMSIVRAPTIDSLIADAARAETAATGEHSVTYDPVTGIPVAASIDWLKDAYDDEMAWHITDFEDLDHPSTSSPPAATAPSS